MLISDWSSDVCSSDLGQLHVHVGVGFALQLEIGTENGRLARVGERELDSAFLAVRAVDEVALNGGIRFEPEGFGDNTVLNEDAGIGIAGINARFLAERDRKGVE